MKVSCSRKEDKRETEEAVEGKGWVKLVKGEAEHETHGSDEMFNSQNGQNSCLGTIVMFVNVPAEN